MRRNNKISSDSKKPAKKTRRRKFGPDPWNDPRTKLELFIAPDLKMRIDALPRKGAQPPEEQEP